MSIWSRSSGALPDGCTTDMLPGNQDRMSLDAMRFYAAQHEADQREIERLHREQAERIGREQRRAR